MPTGHNLSKEVLEKIRHMIEVEKLQQWKIAQELGIHQGTVERVCKRLGLKTQRTGPRNAEGHPKWKGGRVKSNGYWYVYVPDHPYPKRGSHYVLEHRWLIEQKLGRYLDRREVVHHVDGNPDNNSLDNLIVFRTNGEHLKAELKGKCPRWTPEGLERIREGVRQEHIRRKLKRDGCQPLLDRLSELLS
jgi:hypothetical protein